MQLFLLLICHQVTHSIDSLWSHRENHRSIIGECSYCSFICLNFTSTWPISYSIYFLFDPSFLVITHSILSILADEPLPLFQILLSITPLCHCSFPFCIPDSHALSLLSQYNHIVLPQIVSSVVWRNVYKDSVHPLVKQEDVFTQLQYQFQFSQVQV